MRTRITLSLFIGPCVTGGPCRFPTTKPCTLCWASPSAETASPLFACRTCAPPTRVGGMSGTLSVCMVYTPPKIRSLSFYQTGRESEDSMDIFLGLIRLLPYSFIPKGWLPCEGQLLQIQQSTALFSLIGTKFGGDGRTTFALPDLRGFEPQPGTRYAIAITGLYPERS